MTNIQDIFSIQTLLQDIFSILMKFIERLKQYIDYKSISLNAFDKSIGASNGYIGKQIKNGASVGSDMVEKIISTYTDLNLEWLITGKGEMLKQDHLKSEKKDDLLGNSSPPDDLNNVCKVCVEKDKRIQDLLTQIDRLDKMLNRLTSHEYSEQKRKVG